MDDKQQQTIKDLSYLVLSGKLPAEEALPALKLLDRKPRGLNHLINDLNSKGDLNPLIQSLRNLQQKEAFRYHRQANKSPGYTSSFESTLGDFPLDLRTGWEENPNALKAYCDLWQDLQFCQERQELAPRLTLLIQDKYKLSEESLLNNCQAWSGVNPDDIFEKSWMELNDHSRALMREFKTKIKSIQNNHTQQSLELLQASPDQLEVKNHDTCLALLNQLSQEKTIACTHLCELVMQWPNQDIATVLMNLLNDPDSHHVMKIMLSMRFGDMPKEFGDWDSYLSQQSELALQHQRQTQNLAKQFPVLLLALWCKKEASIEPSIHESLEAQLNQKDSRLKLNDFLSRWEPHLRPWELDALTGKNIELPIEKSIKSNIQKPVEEVSLNQAPQKARSVINADNLVSTTPEVEPSIVSKPSASVKSENTPSIWRDHMKPFLSDYWYIMAGVIMVIAGSSLVAYVTWDKHWLLRYTIMPILLAIFTGGMAFLGTWIEKKGREFLGTASILRGAAIMMLPVNFMAVALLSSDQDVPMKPVLVSCMALIYLCLAGWGLRRWCSAIDPQLKNSLSNTILTINALVILDPLANTFNVQQNLHFLLATGFYFGFAILALTIINFSRRILTVEMAIERRIPWFVGAVLIGSFLQVFAWVHSQLGSLPQIHTYAPMIIACATTFFSRATRH